MRSSTKACTGGGGGGGGGGARAWWGCVRGGGACVVGARVHACLVVQDESSEVGSV